MIAKVHDLLKQGNNAAANEITTSEEWKNFKLAQEQLKLQKSHPKNGLFSMLRNVAPSYHELVAAGGGASFYAASAG